MCSNLYNLCQMLGWCKPSSSKVLKLLLWREGEEALGANGDESGADAELEPRLHHGLRGRSVDRRAME